MDVMQAERPRKTKANRFKEAMEAEEAEVWSSGVRHCFFFAMLYDVI